MGFPTSAEVTVNEIDLSAVVQPASTSRGATVISAIWGPVEEIVDEASEDSLVSDFGEPNSTTFVDFFPAANFLAYTGDLQVVRVVGTGALNAAASQTAITTGLLVKNYQAFLMETFSTQFWLARYPGALGNSLGVAWATVTEFNLMNSNGHVWPFANLFSGAPASGQLHIVIYDAGGLITGTVGTVLETYPYVSLSPSAVAFDGTSAFYMNVVNKQSNWMYACQLLVVDSNGDTSSVGIQLGNGADGSTVTDANRQTGFGLFQDNETVDVDLVFAAGAGLEASQWIIDNIGEYRRDCVVFVSPLQTDCVGITDPTTILANITTTRTTYGTSTFAVMDSAWKYQYDKYNDVFRWVPLNGDIAGLCARVDAVYGGPWISPAGIGKGSILNVLKFSWQQNKPMRDALFKMGVNPVIVLPVDGAVLYGDSTLITLPSGFAEIGIRRCLLFLEKSMKATARAFLFQFNNSFTQQRFLNVADPFFRDVLGKGGIADYTLRCNSVNNTPQVIDNNQFVFDAAVTPEHSIHEVILNFILTRTGVDITEILQNTLF